MNKKLFGAFALAGVLAMSVGLAACNGGEDSGKTSSPDNSVAETEVDYKGGYWYSLMVTGGVDYGVGINLYEDGTYYAISTQAIFGGTYTATEATGTVTIGDKEYTKYYTITLSDDPFTESPNGVYSGYDEHCVVADGEGNVLLTDIVDGPSSQALYNIPKQDDYIEETVITVATYYSENYGTDFVKVEFYSDDSYALDGINGVGQAGSIGTYTAAEADGVTTYTLTDDDGETTYSLTAGTTITLKVGQTEYTMLTTDPTAPVEEPEVQITLTASAMGWVNAKLELYDNGTWTLSMDYTTGYNVAAKGTWATDAMYNNVLTVTEDEGNMLAEDTYTLEVSYETYQYSGTIALTLPEMAGGMTENFAFTQAA